MNLSRRVLLATCAIALSLGGLSTIQAQDKPALVFENQGLKNLYKVVFTEWDAENHFASGVIEVHSQDVDDAENPVMRIRFRADNVKADPKVKGTETLEVSSIQGLAFFPPADKKQPYPTTIWKITGRTTKKAVLKAKVWIYGQSAWELQEMEFEKATE